MKLLLGQTGAPTPVVNQSIAGFLDGAHTTEVSVIRNGPAGLLAGDFIPSQELGDHTSWQQSAGSVIGGGRHELQPPHLDVILQHCTENDVEGLALIGGNGTMALLTALSQRARETDTPLRVVGIPKTIDNDLPGLDHSPGFASAATFLRGLLPGIARDHQAMSSIEPVRLIETMGRSVGWLAAAAAAPDSSGFTPVDLVLTPEAHPDVTSTLAQIKDLVECQGRALVVLSEGVFPDLSGQPVHRQNHAGLVTGGVARDLAKRVGEHLGLPTRAEVIGVAQRSCESLKSSVDVTEAYQVGAHAAETLVSTAQTEVMIGIHRSSTEEYHAEFPLVPLESVRGTRTLPTNWIRRNLRDMAEFSAWLAPLITPLAPHSSGATTKEEL